MQPWQCLRRFALAWWERTAEGRARSPREEVGPRDPGGRGEPGEPDQHLLNVARSVGSADPSFERSGVLSWGFLAAASQKVFGLKVGSGETVLISVVGRDPAVPLGGVCALWDGMIRYLPLLWSSLLWVTLSQFRG